MTYFKKALIFALAFGIMINSGYASDNMNEITDNKTTHTPKPIQVIIETSFLVADRSIENAYQQQAGLNSNNPIMRTGNSIIDTEYLAHREEVKNKQKTIVALTISNEVMASERDKLYEQLSSHDKTIVDDFLRNRNW